MFDAAEQIARELGATPCCHQRIGCTPGLAGEQDEAAARSRLQPVLALGANAAMLLCVLVVAVIRLCEVGAPHIETDYVTRLIRGVTSAPGLRLRSRHWPRPIKIYRRAVHVLWKETAKFQGSTNSATGNAQGADRR